jgi:hypothetical protein
MDEEQRLKLMIHRYIANRAIGRSTLRNQGVRGVAKAARKFLRKLNISKLAEKQAKEYHSWLDKKTDGLMKRFPKGAKKNWGAARKAINLLMFAAYFNKVLSREYKLDRFKDVLETPLDGIAAKKLREFARKNLNLRLRFPGIKHLTPQVSEQFQKVASAYAKQKGIHRAELDIILGPSGV